MKVKVLYDQGSAWITEDGIIFQPPFYFGVTDGISGVYLPSESPRLFNERTGGQLVSHIISQHFGLAFKGESLEEILQGANEMVREINGEAKISLEEPGFLPSAAFAVASINDRGIDIVQAGDSLAIWQMKDGTIGGTSNKTYNYEKELLRIIAELMEKHQRNRQKMWEEFRPILIEKRRVNINTKQGGFSLLNGQSDPERFWQKFTFSKSEIHLLVLFSDGLVPFEWTENELGMAGEIVHLYKKGGLPAVLEASRLIADQKKSSSHEDYPEATAIALEFSN